MPYLPNGPPSPFMKSVFSRRDSSPFYVALPDNPIDMEEGSPSRSSSSSFTSISSDNDDEEDQQLSMSEKQPVKIVPHIVITPCTPGSGDEPRRSLYQPRLPQYPMFPSEEEDELFFAAAEAYKLRLANGGGRGMSVFTTLSRLGWTFGGSGASPTHASLASSSSPSRLSAVSRMLGSREGRLFVLVFLLIFVIVGHVVASLIDAASLARSR